jgi:NAD(P)-dependent dehydrogenase (short-subunit alcohol dehydrogenase family)
MSAAPPVALITGSSSGIGLATAVALARAGHRVFATMRDTARSDELLQAAEHAGVAVEIAELDVTHGDAIPRVVADIERRAGSIDVLVNNAGYALGGFFEDVSEAELRAQFETNFFGLAAMTRAVLPGMRVRRRGRIISLSSSTGRVGNPGYAAYSASKHAVEGLSEALRHEVMRFGVHVVLIEPGTYRTECCGRNKCVAMTATDPSSPYHDAMQRWEEVMRGLVERAKDDLGDIVGAIVHAATCERPRLRYMMGWDARAALFGRTLLPERVYDAVVERVFAPRP